jgi:hypothetical protein
MPELNPKPNFQIKLDERTRQFDALQEERGRLMHKMAHEIDPGKIRELKIRLDDIELEQSKLL